MSQEFRNSAYERSWAVAGCAPKSMVDLDRQRAQSAERYFSRSLKIGEDNIA
jgi:hypothetical protein